MGAALDCLHLFPFGQNSIPDLRISTLSNFPTDGYFLRECDLREGFIQNDLGLQTFLRTSPSLRQQHPTQLIQHHPHHQSQHSFVKYFSFKDQVSEKDL